jgi:hypothetical protein
MSGETGFQRHSSQLLPTRDCTFARRPFSLTLIPRQDGVKGGVEAYLRQVRDAVRRPGAASIQLSIYPSLSLSGAGPRLTPDGGRGGRERVCSTAWAMRVRSRIGEVGVGAHSVPRQRTRNQTRKRSTQGSAPHRRRVKHKSDLRPIYGLDVGVRSRRRGEANEKDFICLT